jgi:hypothetical protein
VQWAAIFTRCDLGIGCGSLFQRALFRERDDAMQFWVEALQAGQVHLCHVGRGDLARLDQSREIVHWQKRQRL